MPAQAIRRSPSILAIAMQPPFPGMWGYLFVLMFAAIAMTILRNLGF